MKTPHSTFGIALAISFGWLLASPLAGAAGYKKAEKTGASIAEFRDEIVTIRQEARAALAALNKVVETANSDPRKAFKEFDKAVPRVEASAEKAKKRSDEMKARGKAYFDQWEKELANVNDPAVRQLAGERKARLQGTFDAIRTVMEPARDQFNGWLSSMKSLQTYLENDLTIGGIDAARHLIEQATSTHRGVEQTLDKVIAELNAIEAAITPAQAKK